MNIFKVLGNLGSLLKCGKDIQKIVKLWSDGDKATNPSKEDLLILLEDVVGILTSNLVEIPDDAKKMIASSFEEIKKAVS